MLPVVRRYTNRMLRDALRSALLSVAALQYHDEPVGPARAPARLLLIRPDHLGDLLFLTPGLHRLRAALPETEITLLVGPGGAPIVARNPDIDRIELCPFPGFERQPKESHLQPYQLLSDCADRLRGHAYDAAVILRFDHWWGAWLAAEMDIPRRVGYQTPLVAQFLTEALPYYARQHEVRQNGVLLATLTADAEPAPLTPMLDVLHVPIAGDDHRWATDWLAARGADRQRPLVGIHPGSGGRIKQWPAARWSAVARQIHDTTGAHFLFTGSAAEAPLVAECSTELPPTARLDATGATSLAQLAALLRHCTLVMGPDSGPLHLAVAMERPTMHLFGPSDPLKFGPWGATERHIVLQSRWQCAPCGRFDWPEATWPYHGCMADIAIEQVVYQALALIAGVEED